MGLAIDAREVRINLILDTLKSKPMTIQELADQHGVSYHTIRNDINRLVSEYKVKPNGFYKSGAVTYTAGSKAAEPDLYNEIAGQSFSSWDILQLWGNSGFASTKSEAAAKRFMPLLLQWYNLIVEFRDSGGKTNVNALSDLRAEVLREQAYVGVISSFYRQFAGKEEFWEIASVKEIVEHLDIPTDELVELVNKYKSYMEGASNDR